MGKIIKQAFTLIELLVVIAIIGIFSGLIVVSMNGITQKATIAKAQVFSNSLKNSLMMNLVSEWKFDGTTSDGVVATASDLADNWGGNNCSASGVAPIVKTETNCVSGSCLYFDKDSDGYLTCGNLGTYPSFTINFWERKTSQSDYNCFLEGSGWNNAFHFWSNGDAIYTRVGDGTNTVVMGSVAKLGTIWNNITFITDKNVNLQRLYVNGAFVNSVSISTVTGNTTIADFVIGFSQGNSSPNNQFRGFIDDVRVYSAAMSASQIREHYYVGLNNLLINGGITKGDYLSRINELGYEY